MTTQKEAIAKAPQRRAHRTGLGQRHILTVSGKDPGYTYRIVNDTGDRIHFLENQDWEVVKSDEVQVGDKRIGNPKTMSSAAEVSVGGGQKAIVMKKRIDWHEEDQAIKQEEVSRTEAATKQEALNGTYGELNLRAPR